MKYDKLRKVRLNNIVPAPAQKASDLEILWPWNQMPLRLVRKMKNEVPQIAVGGDQNGYALELKKRDTNTNTNW